MKILKPLKSLTNSIRFLVKIKQKAHRDELAELAPKERGMLFKIIQNISPEKLEQMQTTPPPLSKKQAIAIIEKNLKIIFSEHFSDISSPVFCASIGQVHKLTLKNGTKLATKIQYPDVKETLKSQFNLLKVGALGSKIGKISKWNIDINSHLNLIEERIYEELDYVHELQNLIIYSNNNDKNDIVAFPQYSSTTIFSQSWIEGITLIQIKNKWSKDEIKNVANLIIEDYLKQIFIDGHFQGDCNISNFIISSSPRKVHWIDFGNWIQLPLEKRRLLYILIYKTITRESIDYLSVLEKLDFDLSKIKYFQNLLPNLVQVLFEPFLEDIPYDQSRWNLNESIDHLLGENKWWFRSSGGSQFLELMKAFYGLLQVTAFLEININWHSHFKKLFPLMNIESMDLTFSNLNEDIPQINSLAKYLNIIVMKNQMEHVNVHLPSAAFFDLESLIPTNIKEKLIIRKININDIKFKYLEKGLTPGKVFELHDEAMSFFVYLK